MVTLFHILKWCFPSLCRPSSLLKFLYIFSTENFIDSLDDAKLATDLQPSFLKAIISGKIKMNVLYVFCRRVFCLAQKLQRSQLSRGRKSLQGGLQGPALYTSRGLIHPLFPKSIRQNEPVKVFRQQRRQLTILLRSPCSLCAYEKARLWTIKSTQIDLNVGLWWERKETKYPNRNFIAVWLRLRAWIS